MSVLVIGYGNVLRSDDGIGVRIAELLTPPSEIGLSKTETPAVACSLPHVWGRIREGVLSVISTHQLIPELAESVSQAETVIFIDAAGGNTPGSITVHSLEPDDRPDVDIFAHHLTPARLLAAARDFYGISPRRAWLITVTAKSFEFGETLSPEVESAIPAVITMCSMNS